ncbi:CoA transferase [Terrarubrum flagellatum]|uniref:CaiB/BaiF CoA transferase family protein n=1 Tax=Terrirubrum flagellatum TaxID=2895980 RepID=UPI003144D782
MNPLPLAGIRVVELCTAWAGPMAGRVLAWLGAEVIHVEAPTRTNSWRINKETPQPMNFANGDPGARHYDRTFLFNSQNVNKRSLVLDLKTTEGRAALRDLLAVTDVVTCNFRPGTLEKLGVDYESLARIKPDIIVAEIPAFGLDGPMSGYAALGPTMEMAAGMASLIGYPDGPPETTGPSYLDPIGGFNAAAAIMTALMHRQRTGEGQHIEIPQVEAAMQFIGADLLLSCETGIDIPRGGNHRPDAAPHDAFPAQGVDQWVAIGVFDDDQWRRLCVVIDAPEAAHDPRFVTHGARLKHQREISELVREWTRARDKHAIADALQDAGVPAAPVQTPKDVAASRHLAARGFFDELERPDLGRHPYPGLPVRLSETPGGARAAAPAFGADNVAILRDILGRSDDEITAMIASGVIADAPKPGA